MELVMLMLSRGGYEVRPVLGGSVYSYLCDIPRDNLVSGIASLFWFLAFLNTKHTSKSHDAKCQFVTGR